MLHRRFFENEHGQYEKSRRRDAGGGPQGLEIQENTEIFHYFKSDLYMIAELIASLVLCELEAWTLTMDRTNWKYGKIDIDILTLGVAYGGSAIPLFRIPLRKRETPIPPREYRFSKPFFTCLGCERSSAWPGTGNLSARHGSNICLRGASPSVCE
jgi:hypothetical protein